jgi:UDP-N-acetylmuramate: L-alanyl-gamma-D-glutamyl-meso-diaminopimelate ligase
VIVLVLGACGTFMAGVCLIAAEQGHTVIGVDENVYPPMSDQLEKAGVTLFEGYDTVVTMGQPDIAIIGNVLSRGNVAAEHVLNEGWKYTSGPEWLSREVLQGQHVLAVSGTHGKTTTSSMLAALLDQLGLEPGYLIGGVPHNFPAPARLGAGRYFVIEADEYDSAFFDKRSKFIHYHPDTLIINNLEFDHADIFDDMGDIYRQFQFLLRTVPGKGSVIYQDGCAHIAEVLKRGCWSRKISLHSNESDWSVNLLKEDGSKFEVSYRGEPQGCVEWDTIGQHNVDNAIATLAASVDIGINPSDAVEALSHFSGIKRRMEQIANVKGITIYDDFAHHPTAIQTTIDGLRKKVGNERIVIVTELCSYTMRTGVHKTELMSAYQEADEIYILRPNALDWGFDEMCAKSIKPLQLIENVEALLDSLVLNLKTGDHVLIMSNRAFGGIYTKLPAMLKEKK